MHEGDHVLLYTDGVWDALADHEGRAEERVRRAIAQASEGATPLLEALLSDVDQALAGQPQPDDLTLLTARMLGPSEAPPFH